MTSPDGAHWRVRRRWLDRPLPDLRKRFSEYREENTGEGMFDGFWFIDSGDSPWVGIALAAGVLVLVFVLLPLIGVAIELMLLALLLGSGLVGRVVLRRPWTVEAENLDAAESSASYAVKGWGRSGRAVTEVATAIRASAPPDRISEGIKLT